MSRIEIEITANDRNVEQTLTHVQTVMNTFVENQRKKAKEFSDLFNEMTGAKELKEVYDELSTWADRGFTSQSESVRGLTQSLQESQLTMRHISEMMGELNRQFGEGKIVEDEYTDAMARLEILYRDIAHSIGETEQALQRELSSQYMEADSIEALKGKLSLLSVEYQKLSAAQREGAMGQEILEKMKETSSALSDATRDMNSYGVEVGDTYSRIDGLVTRLGANLPSLLKSPLSLVTQLPSMIQTLEKAQEEYDKLSNAGEEAEPIWKQLVGAALNWKTALIALVPIIIKNRQAIMNWLSVLTTGHEVMESAAKASSRFYQAFADSTGSIGTQVANLKKLEDEWSRLDTLQDKTKFIEENKSAFDALGLSINDVTEAESFFSDPSNTEKAIQAMTIRAKAAVALNLASEKYAEAIQKRVKAEELQEKADKKAEYSDGMNSNVGRIIGALGRGQAKKATRRGTAADDKMAEGDVYRDMAAEFEKDVEVLMRELGMDGKTSESVKKMANNYVTSFLEAVAKEAQSYERSKLSDPLEVLNYDYQAKLKELSEEMENAISNASPQDKDKIKKAYDERVEIAGKAYELAAQKIKDEQEKEAQQAAERQQKELDTLRDQYESYEQAIVRINKKYDDDLSAMKDSNGELLAGFDQENVNRLNSEREKELKALETKYSDTYKNIFKDISKMSKAAMKEALSAAKMWLNEADYNKDPESYQTMQNRVTELEESLRTFDLSGFEAGWEGVAVRVSKVVTLNERLKDITNKESKDAQDITDELQEQQRQLGNAIFATGISSFASGLQTAARALSSIAEISGSARLRDLAEVMNTIGSALEAGVQGALSTGDWVGAAVGVVSSLLGSMTNALVHVFETKKQFETMMKEWADSDVFKYDSADYDTVFGTKEAQRATEAYKAAQDALKQYNNIWVSLRSQSVTLRGKDNNTTLGKLDIWDKDGKLIIEKAQALLDSDEFKRKANENVAAALKGAIEIQQAYEDAMNDVNDYISSIFGNVASDLADAIWEGVENGTDAWDTFKESANDTIKSIAKSMIKELLVTNMVKDWQSKLQQAIGTGDQEYILTTFTDFLNYLQEYIPNAQNLAQKFYDQMAAQGLADDATTTATAKGIAQASQDSVDELNGRFTAIQTHTFTINKNVELLTANSGAIISALNTIMEHTSQLELIREYAYRIEANTDKIATKGVIML